MQEEQSLQNMTYMSQSSSENTDDSMNNLNTNKDGYCGISINNLYHNKSPWNYYCPPLIPSRHHTVLFESPVNLKDIPKPHYVPKASIWDLNHVKMPFSPSNVFPIKENGKDVLKHRWEIIQCNLLEPINSSYELEKAILSYNINLRRRKFYALHYLFKKEFCVEETEAFFENLLPKIIRLALRLPQLIQAPVPLLKQGKPHSISFSQLQISSILANAFLCTFPWKKEHITYPGINFNCLYECQIGVGSNEEVLEKIKSLIHYFRRVCYREPTGVVTFERKHLPRSLFPRWDKVEKSISSIKLHITSNGTIEDGGLGMLQVDFANCMIGGGVLYMGCVQEEIRFIICPELIVSRLITEQLAPNEALLMIGAECYSLYTGYASTFRWSENCVDETPFDDYGRRRISVIAIDAVPYYNSPSGQFAPSKIIRELNKAYVGFYENTLNSNLPRSPVATGNWGCGAFRGNVHLKALIQLMACVAANRHIVYFTFDNKKLQYAIFNIYSYLASNNVTVAQLWRYICKFNESGISKDQFLPFIKQCHIDNLNNTFDDKLPPTVIKNTVKNIFNKKINKEKSSSSTTFTVKKDLENCPSTSKSEELEKSVNKEIIESNSQCDDDIVEASQEDYLSLPLRKFRKVTKPIIENTEVSPNKIKRIKDVSGIFFSSDDDSETEKCNGFLSELDKFGNKSNAVNDFKMDIDALMSSDESEGLMEICVVDDCKLNEIKEATPTFSDKKDESTNIVDSKKVVNKSKKALITDYFVTK